MSKLLTVNEWLQKLPLQKRLQVKENIRKHGTAFTFQGSLSYTSPLITGVGYIIGGFFSWVDTRQGLEYWSNMTHKYSN